MMDQVKFRAMKDGDAADYAFLTEHEIEYTMGTADRLLRALVALDEGLSGYQVTRLGHSLHRPPARSAMEPIPIGLSLRCCMISAIFSRPTITTNMPPLSCAPSCENNAPGLLRNTVIFSCSIMAITWAATETSAKPIAAISILRTVQPSANGGTKTALIRTMRHCQLSISGSGCARCLRGNPMIQPSCALARAKLWSARAFTRPEK